MTASRYRERQVLGESGPWRTTLAENALSLREALDNQEWGAPAKYPKFADAEFVSDRQDEDELVDAFVLADGPIGNLRKRYQFRQGTEVETFLGQNLFLIDLLLIAHGKIRKYFGTGPRLDLKVVKDPEVGEDRRLFVLIRTKLHPEDALDQLDELYDDWWLDALSKADHKMSIDVEYI
jgi:hypothetical protein